MSAARIFTARTRDEMRNIPDDEILTHWLNQPVLVFPADLDTWARLYENDLNELREAYRLGRDTFRVYGGQVRDLTTEARYRWRRLVDKSTGVQHGDKAPRRWERPRASISEATWEQWERDEQRERDEQLTTVFPWWDLLCLRNA